jgi:hypothetical protein
MASGVIHWLKRSPTTERRLRRLVHMSYVAVAALLGGFAYFYYVFILGADARVPPDKLAEVRALSHQLFVLLLILPGMPYLGNLALRNIAHQLGTDGQTLHVKLAGGGQLALPAERLVYDGRKIVHGYLTFPIGSSRQYPLYQDGEVETHITPLLTRAKKLGPSEMFRYQLAHRDPGMIAALIFLVLLIAAIIVSGAWEQLLRR